MRETMLRFSEELSQHKRQQLCSAFGRLGASCDAGARSTKPHLLFVSLSGAPVSPGELVQAAADLGLSARVVDM